MSENYLVNIDGILPLKGGKHTIYHFKEGHPTLGDSLHIIHYIINEAYKEYGSYEPLIKACCIAYPYIYKVDDSMLHDHACMNFGGLEEFLKSDHSINDKNSITKDVLTSFYQCVLRNYIYIDPKFAKNLNKKDSFSSKHFFISPKIYHTPKEKKILRKFFISYLEGLLFYLIGKVNDEDIILHSFVYHKSDFHNCNELPYPIYFSEENKTKKIITLINSDVSNIRHSLVALGIVNPITYKEHEIFDEAFKDFPHELTGEEIDIEKIIASLEKKNVISLNDERAIDHLVHRYLVSLGLKFPENEDELKLFEEASRDYVRQLKPEAIDPYKILAEIKEERKKKKYSDNNSKNIE